MKRAWQAASLACVLLGVFVLVSALDYPFFDSAGPGAGFFPAWLGIILAVLAAGLFVQVSLARTAPVAEEPLLPDLAGGLRVLSVVGSLVAVILLLNVLGFRITLVLFLLFLPAALGVRKWVVTFVFALVGSFGVFHVFYYWLQVPLPIGLLGI
ncbi:MAG: tripartite tricarboxylate transporter TctB family protein [Sphingomonadaceae bacterium]